jgi:diguanylate cyclase (GGDEF)-like protein/PAS domain S-box-containing protein
MDGVVRSFVQQIEGSVLVMDVATPTASFKVRVPDYKAGFPMDLVDARVRFQGVCGAVFNRRNQLVAINLLVPSLRNTRVLEKAPPDPFAVPVTRIADIRRFSSDLPDVHRLKVQGVVTAAFPGRGLFLMDSSGGVYAESQDGTPLHTGDEVEVIGFPARGEYSPVLKSASIRPLVKHHTITPVTITGTLALRGQYDAQLVRIAGTVRSLRQHAGSPALVVETGEHTTFEASFPTPETGVRVPPIGSQVALTGICSVHTDENGNPAAFQIVLRSPADVVVLSMPPWLTTRRATFILFIGLSGALMVLVWVIVLRRRVQQQTLIIQRKFENELTLEERYRRIFERNLTGLYIAREDGTLIDCNNACARILGFSGREQLLQNRADAEAITRKFNEGHGSDDIVNAERRFHRHDGAIGWILSNARLVPHDGDGTLVLEGALVDITDRKVAEERIQSLAHYDSLTGLPNRVLLNDRLSKAIASARRHREKVAVLFLDLDRFKTINDSLGHSCGDALLQQLAQRLQVNGREHDTIARLGGDEFLIVLGAIDDATEAAVVAERVARDVSREFDVQGQSLSITCSIGISIFPEHGEDVETLIKNADAAMYSSKDDGRNTFRFFTSEMTAQVTERLLLENSLRTALDKGQLFLVYQPEFDVATCAITCWEALLRWQHPEVGLIPPDKFIHVAENSGLILPIGEWVLRTACAQARLWQQRGLDPAPIAVNVSAVQFRQEGFCAMVRGVLRDTGLEPRLLELELTESLLVANEGLIFQVMGELKAMGVSLAIDDFGTGYSSLSYLRRFPVRKLKIDRSFIRDLADDSDDAAIVAGIINMAKCLNLHVTAEGVETADQLARLHHLRCDEAQGFLFSIPLSADQAASRMRSIHTPMPAVHESSAEPVVVL